LAPGHGHDTGARVDVTARGRTTSQWIVGGGSYLAGPPAEVYVGLGDATRVELVRVSWDDGRTVSFRDIAVDQMIRVSPAGLVGG